LAADYPKSAEAHYVTAQAAKSAQQTQLALNESSTALSLQPDWELAALLHGEILAQVDPEKSSQFYRQFLKKNPKAKDVRITLARQLANQKDYAGARKEFEHLAEGAPTAAEYHLQLVCWRWKCRICKPQRSICRKPLH